MEKVGRKTSIISMALPQVISWLLIIFATKVECLYVARLIAGFVGGGCFVVCPTFLSEIAETRFYFSLSSFLKV